MSLRQRVLRGGVFLAVRQALGMVIGVGGVLTLTRIIGPSNYGRYAAAVGLLLYVQTVASIGINIFIVRRADEEDAGYGNQAFTLLLVFGVCAAVLLALGGTALERVSRLNGLASEARWMVVLLPLVMIAQVPVTILERGLRYRTVASIELAGQLAYYAVSLPMAVRGHHASAPFMGWAAQQSLMALAQFACARYRPRLTWNRARVSSILSYGVSYSLSSWIWQMRTLVNPLIVGRFAGLESVGVVALAIRLVEYLTFVKSAAWRLSLVALGKMQSDFSRLRRAIEDGMLLQLVAAGPILIVFSWIGPTVVPRLFGPEWVPAMAIYPFIALSYLTNAVFSLHSSALYSLQLNQRVTAFHIAHVILFAGAAFALVPAFGVPGYGLAEIVAVASYIVIHRAVQSTLGAVATTHALAWTAAFGLALFASTFGAVSLIGIVAAALLPQTRHTIVTLGRDVTGALRNG